MNNFDPVAYAAFMEAMVDRFDFSSADKDKARESLIRSLKDAEKRGDKMTANAIQGALSTIRYKEKGKKATMEFKSDPFDGLKAASEANVKRMKKDPTMGHKMNVDTPADSRFRLRGV